MPPISPSKVTKTLNSKPLFRDRISLYGLGCLSVKDPSTLGKWRAYYVTLCPVDAPYFEYNKPRFINSAPDLRPFAVAYKRFLGKHLITSLYEQHYTAKAQVAKCVQ